ncbi:ecotropic viral integration site 5 protein homolog isoform X1 [Pistacia vera]|uniref:ecotropic viral integration site 5 protein homolog isoform X1 n=1 Tax=Pistacia vera TaxID=55513 RepID=UPI001263454F|nr:ecotropic viral integration site 5 protein homolog isoform X1 [Pistacia vera]
MKTFTATKPINPLVTFEHKRDAYGFAVRPQHVQRYREYANIYKEEEEERSDRWKSFLERQAESAQLPVNGLSSEEENKTLHTEAEGEVACDNQEKVVEVDDASIKKPDSDSSPEYGEEKEEIQSTPGKKPHRILTWTEIRPSLRSIEEMMSMRVKKQGNLSKNEETGRGKPSPPIDEVKSLKGASEEDSEDEFYDVEKSDLAQDGPSSDSVTAPATGSIAADAAPLESVFPWKEELEVLVRGGVPMALRGELWQAFVGVRARRVEKYYQDLLASETKSGNNTEENSSLSDSDSKSSTTDSVRVPEKWKGQIEKDLPRTFPGHPALDDDGRNALRRLLTAYARHNPSVGYCQAMNFFAALLLLMMPEENAFWALMGIIDDYFDGYYSEEMIESQVDQLVFEELVRERFPKLVNHLDYLGVQVAWVSGPWFLSIFMNMLPWESVLRVWDVLLFEGNRVMLFRTALALMELYGPALVTTKDAGDAVTLLQSLAGSTFDSSQLVLTACMGFQNVNDSRLQELRNKHRPAVIASVEERSKGLQAWRDSKGLASKLFNFKQDPKSMLTETNKGARTDDTQTNGNLSRSESGSTNVDEVLINLTGDVEIDSVPDLQDQVVWLKVELCKLLDEKRSALLRAEELETALMEMVKQDNRRQLSARVEQLEQEVSELRRAIADKQEQESAMLQVLMRVEQEQKVTEDARRFSEQDAAAQRYAAQVLQEKYEEAMASLAEMEKRVVMAESMLEATLQYQSGQLKAQPSPRSPHPESKGNQEPMPELPGRKISLLARPFGLGWRDRNKQQGKPTSTDTPTDAKSSDIKLSDEGQSQSSPLKETSSPQKETNGNGVEVQE